jgi:glycolate oxidase FAD binding subunit
MEDFIQSVCDRVKSAVSSKTPLEIHGGRSKAFYGAPSSGTPLDMRPYAGIIDYEPRELVLTVRAGTTLAEVETTMLAERQMLPFEPPRYLDGATIGGTVAAGVSGPRRPYAGAVRDFVLGTRVVNGRGEDLRFGGRVIKNVAGYDVSRLMAGAMGTLGVITDISFKVLPLPAAETTLRFEMTEVDAIRRFNEWAGQPLPLSATAWSEGQALVRLSGASAGVRAAKEKLGGEETEATKFWKSLRDQTHDFFNRDETLLRISVPPTSAPLPSATKQLIEWGGGVRWLWVEQDSEVDALRRTVSAIGGHVTVFRRPTSVNANTVTTVFHRIDGKLAELNRNLKTAFDPHNIFNRGRLDSF